MEIGWIDFSKEDRDMLYQISRDHCKDIEIISPQKKEHLNVRDYKFREDVERERRIDAKMLELKDLKESIVNERSLLDGQLSKIIEFYDSTGLFTDEEEREELAKKSKYDMVKSMHELFMERVSSFCEREMDICL